ncbi:YbaB/EbfC family DNA-binding protein [Nocardia sp. NPDC058379]|uniref:YbaB/EbfC family DNA-binding protein n=1 Tax=unclassified Nocardia TaxID=2637762 RepID=UPI003668D695
MNEDWSAPTRAANDALRAQVDAMLDSFTADKSALLDAQRRATEPVSVWSEDNLVRVTGTIAGVSEVHIEPDAFKRSTPDSLGRSITEAITAMTIEVRQVQEQAMAPIANLTGQLPDLPDLVPGAVSMKDLIAQLTSPPADTEPEAPRRLVEDSDDDEGDYFRNRSYLR